MTADGFDRGFLEHVVKARSQYDGTCRTLASMVLVAAGLVQRACFFDRKSGVDPEWSDEARAFLEVIDDPRR